jgi:hypothetical protein
MKNNSKMRKKRVAEDPEYERLRATIAGPKPVTDPVEWKATCERLGMGTNIPALIKQAAEKALKESTPKKTS